jgi:hypothetical protein
MVKSGQRTRARLRGCDRTLRQSQDFQASECMRRCDAETIGSAVKAALRRARAAHPTAQAFPQTRNDFRIAGSEKAACGLYCACGYVAPITPLLGHFWLTGDTSSREAAPLGHL